MLCRTLQADSLEQWREATGWLAERSVVSPEVEEAVRQIIGNIGTRGDAALIEYTREYDCQEFCQPLRVSKAEIAQAAAFIPVQQREHIDAAACNIRKFHEAQVEKSWFMTRPDGTILGQRVTPVDSVGLYVPGGKAGATPLVSSLLMNAIPALVAGCRRIVVVSPPGVDGALSPYILAAAYLLDIDEVYRVGGAWSIAALALGTESIQPVDVIAGPGNIYVTTAKRLLHGRIGIDMIAGPSEVLVIADAHARPAWIAADMLSQAEHDTLASAICLVESESLAAQIQNELESQLVNLPRNGVAAKSLADWGCIGIVPNLRVAVDIANHIAPEHLELCTRDPWSLLPFVRNAGAVFLGEHSPEPLGDYFAGPNHVLPTLGTARFSSALSVQTFCKKTSIIAASRTFLGASSDSVVSLARLEGLEAHAASMEIRQNRRRR